MEYSAVLTVHVDCHRRHGRLGEVIVGGLAREDCHQIVALQGQDFQLVPHHPVGRHGVGVVQQHRFAPPRHGGEGLACKRRKWKISEHLDLWTTEFKNALALMKRPFFFLGLP
ncbi:hypothetical protein AVEN_69010-1 [Araneus ventricosus]|uniref:Uncharacterized protein n=1 Tax=Araneus ventricosus TaxID=182803 RepID=A0A4Y2HZL2_ARAVE|nr:hypothetical protein AVEN_69010-1 [Araneus ventricosus]